MGNQEPLWVVDDIIQTDPNPIPDDASPLSSEDGNTITIDRCDYSSLTLWLNDDIVNLDKKVKVVADGKVVFNKRVPRTSRNLYESLRDREDTSYCFPAKIRLALKK